MEDNKQKILQVLNSFNIGIENITEYQGNTLTLYQIKPKIGVRISRIRNLKDELAVGLSVPAVRIIAPMENGTVGIEIPNKKREVIPVSEIFNSWIFQNTGMTLPCAVGRTVTGEVFVADLTEMPHLLVAGATGQGKSVGLNVILLSLLSKKTPDELKLVLIDPKQVEFGVYSKLDNSYLATPVITSPKEADHKLQAICSLMDERYSLLSSVGVRNISEYNAISIVEPMPYIVVVIDEFGDLIMTSGKELERTICRIAQKARAVGIHLIISTQRPDSHIVTGNIKANFPTRIAFRTTTAMDSRLILDQAGAEKLTGKGDMLFFNGNETTRIQCAYATISDIISFCDTIYTKYVKYHNTPIVKEQISSSITLKMPLLPDIEELAIKVARYPNATDDSIKYMANSNHDYAKILIEQLKELGIITRIISGGFMGYNVPLYNKIEMIRDIIRSYPQENKIRPFSEYEEQIIKHEFDCRRAKKVIAEDRKYREEHKDAIEARRRQLYRNFYGSNNSYMTFIIPNKSKLRNQGDSFTDSSSDSPKGDKKIVVIRKM